MVQFDADKLWQQLLYDEHNPLLFNSGFFVYFFAIFICLFYAFRNQNLVRSYIVSIFSLYFFYKASGGFVLMVMASAIGDYVLSNLIYRQQRQGVKKLLLGLSIVLNLGMLIYFKYTDFFIDLSNQFFSTGINPLNIMLPVGISFYTFENISYTIDVYKGDFVPERKFINYLLFLSFFPKLMMGPIVRAKDFIPQLHRPYFVTDLDFSKGFYLIVSGLFKKLIISDYLTLNLVNYVFEDPSRHTGLECMVALLAYAMVIYCDFSGYSDVAIGIARWMGVYIPPNFLSPYQSKSITEFWRRWHISLSSWLKDYLYIFGLGGNRKGNVRTYVNLFITMLLGGLWHGANMTFIVWGGLHGAALGIHKVYMEYASLFIKKVAPYKAYQLAAQLLTFMFVCFCWIYFKAENITVAHSMMHQIAYNFSFDVWGEFFGNYQKVIYLMILAFLLHLIPDNYIDKILPRLQKVPLILYIVVFLLFLVLYAQFKSSTPVLPIYLQF